MFAVRVVNPWNKLPDDVVSSTSIAAFKSKLGRCDLTQFLKYDLS